MTEKQSFNPLNILSTIGVLGAYLFGIGMLTGLYLSEMYPATMWIILASSAFFLFATTHLFRRTLNACSISHKIFSVLFSLFFIFMILISFKLKPDLLANPLVTKNSYHFMEVCYYGILVMASLGLHALQLKSNVVLDKKNIPWTVHASGLMLLVIGYTFTIRHFILHYLNIPLYNQANYTLIFLSISIMFFTIQFIGKYGPFYRTTQGQRLFLGVSIYMFLVAILHLIGPLLNEIAFLYHYTGHQLMITQKINHISSWIEITACIIIFLSMQLPKTKQYYSRLEQ